MSNDPYTSPSVDEPTAEAAATPRPGAILFVVCVALFCGTMVFLGTCFSSGLVAFDYLYRNNPNSETVIVAIWGGSGLIGTLSALFVGRNMYRRAQRMAAVDAAEELRQ